MVERKKLGSSGVLVGGIVVAARGEAVITFDGGNLASPAEKQILISSKNAVTYPAPAFPKDKLKLIFNPGSGTLSGSFFHDGISKAATFSGVILQKQQEGGGFFFGADDSGTVEIRPQS